MSLLSFNCRGSGNFSLVNSLRDLIRKEAPLVVFLLETKLISMDFNKVKDKLGDSNSIAVDFVGWSEGLAMLWRRDVVVNLLSMCIYHIDVIVQQGLGKEEWRCTAFYWWPQVHNIHLLQTLCFILVYLGFVLVILMKFADDREERG